MTSAQATGSTANTYLYDANNRRVKQTDGKGTSYSVYSQAGTLLYRETNVENGSGDPVNYIYLGSKLIAKDGVIADADATSQHSRPFGDSIETPKDDVGYTGHKFDTDLDLSYMQARYYDPVIGRFYSDDPVGFRDVHSFNRYAYANNNPYKYTDPDGNNPVCLTPISALACAGVIVAGYGVKKFVDKQRELGESSLKRMEAEQRRQQAYVDCITSGGSDCSKIAEAESEAQQTRNDELKKAAEATEAGCIVGTMCGGPIPTTTVDNATNGGGSILNWLFGDDDDDETPPEPPKEEPKKEKKLP